MKDKVIFFVLGAVIGSVSTYFIVDKKNKAKFNREIDNRVNSAVDEYKKLVKEKNNEKVEDEDSQTNSLPSSPVEKPDLMEYVQKISKEHNYYNYSDVEEREMGVINNNMKGPYVVSSSEIPMGIEEDIVEYTHFADGTLVNSDNEPLTEEEIENTCGFVYADFFGKDPEDPNIVYVRNDVTDRYYEIKLSESRYEE